MVKRIAVLPGDGVGPEVVAQAIRVLEKIGNKYGHRFEFKEGLIGAVAIDKTGDPYPKDTQKLCSDSDAILFGAIGDPKYDNDPGAKIRPEQGLLRMRKHLGLYANIRPIRVFDSIIDRSPLKRSILEGVDFVVVRELVGGIYFGEKGRNKNGSKAFDVCSYSKKEIKRIAKVAFELAKTRLRASFAEVATKAKQGFDGQGKVTVVDKANVLETSRLWRETVREYSKKYKSINVEYMFVDNAAMQIIKNPQQFDVILTENMFGDILTDEASVITGSIGMLPSSSIGERQALYEPIHGSYPKAAGLNTANPAGTILSAAMMLEYSFGLVNESKAIISAVEKALENGYGTHDISGKPISTTEFTDKIISYI